MTRTFSIFSSQPSDIRQFWRRMENKRLMSESGFKRTKIKWAFNP
jgi:hypothetical protein